ncbi:MAG: bifunctional 4-hydroxy-2-oxoglutarate aldolase/2-dehydro-3-deoxy-phosphogluconate aldolase [Erysipelotrichaceae bacterium]|nr:bifunctional 4-hydroxy-2-oxoglutarate aldolase/2-dehydro-3-deoxy-phosphogluconate aldolase [Erysipelotrichaceae bacterium]
MRDLTAYRIIPTVTINDSDDAVKLAEALIKGGIPIAEVTFRTAAAQEAIRKMSKVEGILVGAGSVINADQAKQAIEAGAQFVVSPGLNPEVVTFCQKQDVAVIPGAATPSEIMAALNLGVTLIKIFPAGNLGGTGFLKAVSAPFPAARFMPTGGVNPDNMNEYLSLPCVQAVGGSWMVKSSWIDNHQFETIVSACKESVGRLEK